MSTHLVHPPGVAALQRWGLLERLEATGCPPVKTYSFDFGPLTISGSPRPIDGIAHGYCPRRTILDQLLVDAAVEAGAELREGFPVDEILAADGAVTASAVTPRGRGGHRARARGDRRRRQAFPGGEDRSARAVRRAPVAPGDVLRLLERPARRRLRHHDPGRASPGLGGHSAPTTISRWFPSAGRSRSSRRTARDIEGNFLTAIELAPEFAERVRAAKRESKFIGSAELPGYFRKPFGTGWALLGDAGYHKNPITAMGINDAFRDAELVAGASMMPSRGGAHTRRG